MTLLFTATFLTVLRYT